MKLTALFITLWLCTSLNAQQNTTEIFKSQTDANTLRFEFTSVRPLDEFIESKWEQRFPIVHQDLISIDILPDTQKVIIELPENYNEETLSTIAGRFQIVNFNIVEQE